MNKQRRPSAHETDTLARRKVPMALPAEWEHRELTGRDYGIDMVVEIYREGNATGGLLSLQIKGTKKVDLHDSFIKFDVPIETLKYSEIFIAPVLLVLCPVSNENNEFYYLWLQEYIKVVLDYVNPEWRKNKKSVRVSIPVSNCMPGNEKKLDFISRFPKRLFDWCQYARICEDIKFRLNSYLGWDDVLTNECFYEGDMTSANNNLQDDLLKLIQLISEMTELKGIFDDPEWSYPQYVLNDIIVPSLLAAQNILNGTHGDEHESKRTLLRIKDATALIGIYNDYNFSRTLWEEDGNYMF